jgi:hypothetical protein
LARQAEAVDPEVLGSYTLDGETHLYTYTYRVRNGRGATSGIWYFAIAPVPRPLHVGKPSSRWGQLYGFQERDDALVWLVTDPGPVPADSNSVDVWPSPFDIQPGDSAVGFSLTTEAPPGVVSWFAQGFYPAKIPLVISVNQGESTFDGILPLFQVSVTGTTVGPRATDVKTNAPE